MEDERLRKYAISGGSATFVKTLNLQKVDEILHYFLLLGSHLISINMIIVVLRSKCMTFPCMSVFIRILIYMGSPYASLFVSV